MTFQEVVITVIKGIIVTNITHTEPKFLLQVQDFLLKSKAIPNMDLVEVKNENALSYIESNKIDFCIFWDKDIYLARTIANSGVKVFNTPEAIYLCDDKALTAMALDAAKVNQPNYYVLPMHFYGNIFDHYDKYRSNILKLGFPLVIKERFGSFGEQVYLAHNEEEAKTIIKDKGLKPLLVQEFISETSGTDYRLNVVGNEVVLTVKRVNSNDFRSNINQGGSAYLYEATPIMKETAISALKAVNGHFGGVDIMLRKDGTPVVIEVNSNMRTIAVNKVSDIDLTLQILKYIKENI